MSNNTYLQIKELIEKEIGESTLETSMEFLDQVRQLISNYIESREKDKIVTYLSQINQMINHRPPVEF